MHRNIEDIHHRRSIRLQNRDYTAPGTYFVTICARERTAVFGDVQQRKMVLNAYGIVAEECWRSIPDHFRSVVLDEFVVMPDHVHGIVEFRDDPEKGRRGVACDAPTIRPALGRGGACPAPTRPNCLGDVIGSFKSAVTRRTNLLREVAGESLWQRNYYEHIIRSSRGLEEIRQYIVDNPKNWALKAPLLHPLYWHV